MNYSDRHVQYLLNGIDRTRPLLDRTIGEDTFGLMRRALRENEHEHYRKIARKHGLRLCEFCHVLVYPQAALCDACWELDHRVDSYTLSLWGDTPKGIVALHKARDLLDAQIKASPLKEAFLRGDFS